MDTNHLVKLPGLIDVHVHLRVPGGEHKEDFHSGSAAALAGGFTHVMAMPNTHPPLITLEKWQEIQQQAIQEGLCEVSMYCGATAASLDELKLLGQHAPALKLYLDQTYSELKVSDSQELNAIARVWPRQKVLALHAEGESIRMGIKLAEQLQRPVHFCHVSRREEIEWIADAKSRGLPVTCEVTPHHLFLTKADAERLGPLGDMRPRLAEQQDVDALWEHINSTIDVIATDHAPHTIAEKNDPVNPPPGVPGLESALPLMLTAVADGRLSLERMITLMYFNPLHIFGLADQPDTWVEVDMDRRYIFPDHPLYTKCGWTPFSGFQMCGAIHRVVLKGREVMLEGIVCE